MYYRTIVNVNARRAALNNATGRMWPACRSLPTPDLEHVIKLGCFVMSDSTVNQNLISNEYRTSNQLHRGRRALLAVSKKYSVTRAVDERELGVQFLSNTLIYSRKMIIGQRWTRVVLFFFNVM